MSAFYAAWTRPRIAPQSGAAPALALSIAKEIVRATAYVPRAPAGGTRDGPGLWPHPIWSCPPMGRGRAHRPVEWRKRARVFSWGGVGAKTLPHLSFSPARQFSWRSRHAVAAREGDLPLPPVSLRHGSVGHLDSPHARHRPSQPAAFGRHWTEGGNAVCSRPRRTGKVYTQIPRCSPEALSTTPPPRPRHRPAVGAGPVLQPEGLLVEYLFHGDIHSGRSPLWLSDQDNPILTATEGARRLCGHGPDLNFRPLRC